MGNACTIHYTPTIQSQKLSPNPSLVFPPAQEILESIHSQQKGDCLSQVNYQSTPASAISIPTLNVARPLKRPVYTIDKQNLSKAIQGQISPIKKTGTKSAFTFGKLPAAAYQLSKEKWSKESSFIKQNPPSFHASVSEINEDGYMEYSRDSESLKVEDLWQDVSRSVNSEFQKGFEDRRRSEGYLAMQEGYLAKYFNGEDYRRGSIEAYGHGDNSTPKKNLKKEEVRMYQVRLEKEESTHKLSLFAKGDKDAPVNDQKDPQQKLRSDIAYNVDVNCTQLDKELRMVQGLTTVAESFSPIKKSQNASPNNKSQIFGEENPFREEKSLYSESVTPFELSPMKMHDQSPPLNYLRNSAENYHSASKISQTGLKPLVKYCSVGALESALVTGLYEGVEALPQNNESVLEKLEDKQKDLAQEQCKYDSNPKNVYNVDKTYASVRSSASREGTYSGENCLDISAKKEVGARRSSLMDRLMESLLEEKYKKDESKVILESIDKESPLPSVRRDPLEKERRNYGKNKPEYNSRQKLDYTADQSQSYYSVTAKPPIISQDNTMKNLQESKSIKNSILQEMEASKDMNKAPRPEQFKKDSETHNSLVSSAYVSHRTSPQLKSEVLDFSREYILNQMEEAQKVIKGKDKRFSENSFQRERGEIVTDQKAIVQEIKNLQKEVFERMSVVTSNMKGKMLTPKKMLELRDIQDKIQILTQLGSMIEAGEAKKNKEAAASAQNRKSTQSSSKEIPAQSKMSQQKSQKSLSKDTKNYFSCSKPSSTSSQNIKRNSSVSNIHANTSNKSSYTSKNNISTEHDSSLVKPPSGGPSESTTTQEFLETEIECIHNPKEVWRRQNDAINQRSYKSLPWASESKSAQKPVETSIVREFSQYQTVEPKPRKVTEVLSTSKSYLANDLSADISSAMFKQAVTTGKESLRQSTDLKDSGANIYQNVIKKLSYAKNLSTYAASHAQQKESRTLTPEPSAKSIKQPVAGVRRQSAIGEKTESRRTSTGHKELSKSRVSSLEKIKPNPPVQEKQGIVNRNESQLKHQTSNKRLSVGSSSTTVKEYSIDLMNYRGKSPLPKSYAETEKKRKISQVSQTQENIENVESVSELPVEENFINDSKLENDQAELLCEEITKLDQKLAVTKSTSKITVLEDIIEKSPYKKTQMSDVGLDKGNKKGSYIKQAIKKIERHVTPLVGRVNRQNPNQASEVPERRQTISNLSVQQEQSDVQTVTEAFCGDGKKGKYDYNQALQMRIKYAEEAARKQSIVESTEWIFNAKLPLYAGKVQDKAKKN